MHEIRTIKQGVIDCNLVKASKTNGFQDFVNRNSKAPGEVRVFMVDELGITAELILHNIQMLCSANQIPDVTIFCAGPVAMYYPEGTEEYNGIK